MNPTILIGLDGATFTVLDALIADGHLPFLKQFMAGGVRAELRSTPHPLTPPAWTTLATGRTPGSHGIFDFLRAEVRKDGAFYTLNNFRDIQCETIWTLVSRLGGRVISLNFPVMAPPPTVNGFVVPGFLSWRHLRRNVYPASLYDDIKALPGFDAKELSWDFENETAVQTATEDELEPWVRFHIQREQHWFDIFTRLLDRERWDLAAVMFDGVDKLQHACWQFLDPDYLPANPTPTQRTLRGWCLQYFRQLDDFLRLIVERGGRRANVLIASDHGFGPTTHVFRVNKWLEQQGYLRWPDRQANGDAPQPRDTHFVRLDWKNTSAYAQSTATNGVHIRLKEGPDDPVGVPPEQYVSFRDRLIEQLRAVRETRSGRPFLKEVLKREDVFPGSQMHKAPDLTLVPFDHGFVSVLDVEPVIAARPSVRGTHYPDGILLAAGPSVPRGVAVPRQSILDIAPTLLHSLGLPVPEDYEGRVIEEVFSSEHRRNHPAHFGSATVTPKESPGRTAGGLDAHEEEVILNRLRALGYVE